MKKIVYIKNKKKTLSSIDKKNFNKVLQICPPHVLSRNRGVTPNLCYNIY